MFCIEKPPKAVNDSKLSFSKEESMVKFFKVSSPSISTLRFPKSISLITSPSTVKNLAKLFDTHDLGKTLPGMAVACIGSVTAAAAAEYGLQVDIQPEQFTTKDLAQAIAAYFDADKRG